ncbi:MAG: branched-chain amino acid transport system permease protein [Actinomycetota bacterium]|nr:branched-chain amino acid transport system permease protein [Actinomycetota bacterium]
MPAVHDLLLAIGFGLVTSSIIAIGTVALSLQYSVTNVPNFAHGEIMTIAGYGALQTSRSVHSIPLQILVSIVLGAFFAWAMNRLLLQPFLNRGARNLVLFVLTIAISLILQNTVLLIYGGQSRAFTIASGSVHHYGPFQISSMGELTVGAAVAVMLLIHVLLKYTAFGKAQRAVSDSRELSRVSGVNADRVVAVTWLLAGGIAGVAGYVLAATIGSVTPTIGNAYLIVIFAAAVVGGIGRAYGAMIGALIIGMSMEISAVYLPSEYKTVVAFSLLVLALIFRPGGILSTKVRNAVD